MRQHSKKQMMCYILIILLFISSIMQPIPVYGIRDGEQLSVDRITVIKNAKQNAMEWLLQQQDEDGKFGTSSLINDTCMVLEQAEEENTEANSDWLNTQMAREENQNTDTMSRAYCAMRQEEKLIWLRSSQNPDGGYGLTPNYESEALDSMLVLEAFACAKGDSRERIGEDITDSQQEEVENRLISYIQSIQQKNGGFAYVEGMEPDMALTLRIGIAIAGIQNMRSVELQTDVDSKNNRELQNGTEQMAEQILEGIDGWISDYQLQPLNLKENFEESAYQCLYLLYRNQGAELEDMEEELLAIQQEDGSFNESIADTVLGIRLLRAWEKYYTPYIQINHMETSLSSYTAIMNRTTEITVMTTCEYAVNYEAEVTWRILLCEDNVETEVWRQTGILSPGGEALTIEQPVSVMAESEKEYMLKVELIAEQTVLSETHSRLYTREIVDTELELNGEAVTGEDYTIKLLWNDVSDDNCRYGYRLYRRTGNGDWETRSVWNGEEKVRVLNIYPTIASKQYLINWMTETISDSEEPAGMGLFEIDTVYIKDYNNAPDTYLMDEDGIYKYDVLVFGTADNNGYCDLNQTSYDASKRFADAGGGILFGHDTVSINSAAYHPYFAKFADDMGIILKRDGHPGTASKVNVIREGFLTSYPWKLSGTLEIPPTHVSGQYAGGTTKGTIWMECQHPYEVDTKTGAVNNGYLITSDSLAIIQTGHSNGNATDDERKVFANTIFYLKQLTNDTEAVDHSAYDMEVPEVTGIGKVACEEGRQTVAIQGCDHGTQYEYYVEALAKSDAEGLYRKESTPVTVNMTSGIQGYLIGISDSSSAMDSLICYDGEGNLMNVCPCDDEGNYTYVLDRDIETDSDTEPEMYIHVRAVDYAGNIGEEMAVKLETETVIPELPDDTDEYFNTGYALFSTEDTVIYGSSVDLYGISYVGTGMTFGGNSIGSTGLVQSTGAITTYAGNTLIAERVEYGEAVTLPDYRASILADMTADGSIEEIAVYSGISIQTPVHCQSTTGVYCPNLSLGASLLSENSIYISTDQITVGGGQPVAVCSAHGDIYINAMALSGNGLIYAPEGTVTIQVSQMDFKGSIIARRICLQGDTLQAGTERE